MLESPQGGSFWEELKQRRVVRVAVFYAIVGWAVIEGSQTLTEILALPDWTPRLVLVFALLGFPGALVFAWAFQVTGGGVQRPPSGTVKAHS